MAQEKTGEGEKELADGQMEAGQEAMLCELELREATVMQLKQSLEAKDAEIAALKKERHELRQTLDGLNAAILQAVAAYREMVLQANPALPPELISGNTIEEIKEAVKRGRILVEKIRQEMEAELARLKVPTGAPPRTAPDLSGLSAREKIQYAIRGLP